MKPYLCCLLLLMTCLAVGLLAVPHAVAQEPVYLFSIPSHNSPPLRMRATLKTTYLPAAPGTAAGARVLRVHAVPLTPTGQRDLSKWDLTVYVDADGWVERAYSRYRRKSGQEVVLEGAMRSGDLTVRFSARDETLPLGGAPVTTLPDLLAFAGKRYDAKKKGKQTFAFIGVAGIGGDSLQAGTVTLDDAGPETLTLSGERIAARRLRVTFDFPSLLPDAPRTGTILIGPQGETLAADVRLAWFSFQATEPAEREGDHRILRFTQPEGQLLRIRPDGSGYAVTIETPSRQPATYSRTDALYRPVRLETKTYDDVRMGATITPTQARWQRGAGLPIPVPLTGELWLLTHFLATDLWEGDGAPAPPLAVGKKREETTISLQTGALVGYVRTRERLPDVALPADRAGEQAITLRHYRLTFPGEKNIDLWTDGRRLVKIAGSDGYLIERSGWETRTAALPPPPAPRSR